MLCRRSHAAGPLWERSCGYTSAAAPTCVRLRISRSCASSASGNGVALSAQRFTKSDWSSVVESAVARPNRGPRLAGTHDGAAGCSQSPGGPTPVSATPRSPVRNARPARATAAAAARAGPAIAAAGVAASPSSASRSTSSNGTILFFWQDDADARDTVLGRPCRTAVPRRMPCRRRTTCCCRDVRLL